MTAAGPERAGMKPPQAEVPETAQALEQDIEQTREQLGQTVAELVAKADIKSRARDKAHELTGQLKAAGKAGAGTYQERVLLGLAAGGVVVATVLIVWGSRR